MRSAGNVTRSYTGVLICVRIATIFRYFGKTVLCVSGSRRVLFSNSPVMESGHSFIEIGSVASLPVRLWLDSDHNSNSSWGKLFDLLHGVHGSIPWNRRGGGSIDRAVPVGAGLAGRSADDESGHLEGAESGLRDESGPIHRPIHSSGQTGLAAERIGLVSGGDRRAVAGQAGLTKLRRFSGWPARMRPRAIASMIVSAMLMRSCIFANPRIARSLEPCCPPSESSWFGTTPPGSIG